MVRGCLIQLRQSSEGGNYHRSCCCLGVSERCSECQSEPARLMTYRSSLHYMKPLLNTQRPGHCLRADRKHKFCHYLAFLFISESENCFRMLFLTQSLAVVSEVVVQRLLTPAVIRGGSLDFKRRDRTLSYSGDATQSGQKLYKNKA